MGNQGDASFLSCSSDDNLAKKLSDFFIRRAAEIRDATSAADNASISETVVRNTDVAFVGQLLTQLEPSTKDEVT